MKRFVLAILGITLFCSSSTYALQPVQALPEIKQALGIITEIEHKRVASANTRVPLVFKEIPLSGLASTRAHPVQAASPSQATSKSISRIDNKKRSTIPSRSIAAHEPGGVIKNQIIGAVRPNTANNDNQHILLTPLSIDKLLGAPPIAPKAKRSKERGLRRIRAKALFCVDCSTNKVLLAHNVKQPLPIASITKLLTAMVVIDEMDLDRVVEAPKDILYVRPKKVGIRPGYKLTVRDLLHGMLVVSGNDCAEVLARAYPHGGRSAFIKALNRKAISIGAKNGRFYTPSGLDKRYLIGRKSGRSLVGKNMNTASAMDVAIIARHAFHYPLIREITSKKSYTMITRNEKKRKFRLRSNDRLLFTDLPVAGAKTGFTNKAGRCIVAQFKGPQGNYMIVVLNSPNHFKAAATVYKWAAKSF